MSNAHSIVLLQLERMKKAEEHKQQAEGPARQALEFFELKNKHTRITNKLLTLKKFAAGFSFWIQNLNIQFVQMRCCRRSDGGYNAS
jgi:hypothetical protein